MNMIFFSGFGFLVPVIVALGFLLPTLLEQWVKRQFGIHTPNSVVMTLAVIIPFLGMLGLHSLLNKQGPTRKAVDVNTGKTVEIATTHTFMFLPVKWCAFIWLGLAICTTIVSLLN
jgi:hypothetical protein